MLLCTVLKLLTLRYRTKFDWRRMPALPAFTILDPPPPLLPSLFHTEIPSMAPGKKYTLNTRTDTHTCTATDTQTFDPAFYYTFDLCTYGPQTHGT